MLCNHSFDAMHHEGPQSPTVSFSNECETFWPCRDLKALHAAAARELCSERGREKGKKEEQDICMCFGISVCSRLTSPKQHDLCLVGLRAYTKQSRQMKL